MVITSAQEHNLPLWVAHAAARYFGMAVSQGLANEDSARIMQVIQRMTEI